MDNKTIRTLQKIQLQMLLDFHKACQAAGITFFLYSGTLLGAVKYKGFIPWDDDIDVALMRSEYEKLLRMADDGTLNLPPQYMVQHCDNDPFYPLAFGKLRLKNTYMTQWHDFNAENSGIYIDIFPLDYIPQSKIKRRAFFMSHKILQAMYFAKVSPTYKASSRKRRLIGFCALLIPRRILVNLRKSRMLRLQKAEYVANLYNSWGPEKECFPAECFTGSQPVIFEGGHFPAPINAENCLRKVYGDIWKDPPKDKQVSHHEYERLDFGPYAENGPV